MALVLNHQTLAQFVARLRARYRGASRLEALRLAKWIIDRIELGDLTDLQVRTAFGLNTTQWTALKTKMTNMRTNYDAVQAAAGE